MDRAARGDRGRGRQRRRACHRARRRRRRAGPDAAGDGHLDLPRHERRRAGRGAGHVRRRATAGSCPGCGATRPARAASATSSAGSSTSRCRRATTTRRAPAARPARPPLRARGAQEVGAHGLIALDWNNGNRSVLVDHELSGLIVGLTLATPRRGRLPRADRGDRVRHAHDPRGVRRRRGSRCDELFVAGGLIKNPFVMQIYADVSADAAARDRAPTRARRSARRCTPRSRPALHPDIHAAAAAMGSVERDAYVPDERARRRLRPAVRALHAAARPLRPRRRRRHARACATCARGSSSMADELRREVCALHAELPRNGLVAWTSRQPLGARPGRGADGHQAQRRALRRAHARRRSSCATSTATSSRATLAPSSDAATHGYVYRALPERRRHRAHAQPVRDRVGDPRRADPVRDDRDGRRVRRRDPRRAVRA